MKTIEDKIKEIHNRKPFLGFWDCFEYMRHANFDEIESLLLSSKLFNGKIWDGVVSAKKINKDNLLTNNTSTTLNTFIYRDGVLSPNNDEDDILVEIYVLTPESNPMHMEIYKAYVETKKYQEVPTLESHLKLISIVLETELGIRLFTNGAKTI